MSRKEYNNRINAPLVNPGFALAEYEAGRVNGYETKSPKPVQRPKNLFTPTIDGVPAKLAKSII